jgi:dTDP-4-amino-4,6-dideoxygalactose transaminase
MGLQLGIDSPQLVPSCTAALELACLLADLKSGDEVVMPSFTFSSTANAVTLRGATPVFIDIRADTLNIDETLIESAITTRTRAIVVVHYAGVCADMDAINRIAQKHNLIVIEDAAQAYLSFYRGRPAGMLADMGAFSFHETKNFGCGEGGAFTTASAHMRDRAEIIREKGTNRSRFLRGEVDKYSWVATGSSLLASEFQAAVLLAQLERAQALTSRRLELWSTYHTALAVAEQHNFLRRPHVPTDCVHNAHIYHVLLHDERTRDDLKTALKSQGIASAFHFVPLHSAPEGLRTGRTVGDLPITESVACRLLRLPIHAAMDEHDVARVVDAISQFFS